MYHLFIDEKLQKKIKKLDKAVKLLLNSYIRKNLLETDNPRKHGKALTGNLKGWYRYRIMDYRLLVKIEDENLIIIALDFEHRSKIYK
ncbi:type II toxin-antitoxin system RelE family toxin [Fusobacterium sp. PH5-44]|uniref:type II toxin-antitoxin system RelE family toxin n=1 Tax=unclassified Fusobacterium TaxID=2648384 RepID=UPI003D1E8B19